MGDSTVADGNDDGVAGWGKYLPEFFDPDRVKIVNKARLGRSTRGYRHEGLWKKVEARLQPGDFVLIQFGHNDGGPVDQPHYQGTLEGNGEETTEFIHANGVKEVVHTFGWYLRQYVVEIKAKAALPVILSHVPRNKWVGNKIERCTETYARWSRQAAEDSGAFYIDLNECIATRYEELGTGAVSALFSADRTHTNADGARLNALVVAQTLCVHEIYPLCFHVLQTVSGKADGTHRHHTMEDFPIKARDCFRFVPCSTSDHLVIVFSGVHSRNFTGYRLFEDIPVNRLFIRDPGQSWYNGPIPHLCNTPIELLKQIRKVTDGFHRSRITLVGSSMGGYAAILFGCLLEAGQVVAFGPQLYLDANLPNTPGYKQKLYYPCLHPLIAQNNGATQFIFYMGSEELPDFFQVAPSARHPHVTVHCVYGAPHNVIAHLNEMNLLKPMLESYAAGCSYTPIIPKIDPFGDFQVVSAIQKAVIAHYHGQPAEAEASCRSALNQAPVLPSLWAFLGRILLSTNRDTEAAQALQRALELQPHSENAQYDLGLVYFRAGHYHKAQEHLLKSYQCSTYKKLGTLIKLTVALREQGKLREALPYAAEAVERYPKSHGVHYQFGVLQELTGNLPAAEKALSRARKLAPKEPKINARLESLRRVSARRGADSNILLAFGDAMPVGRLHHYYETFGPGWILNDVPELADKCSIVLANLETVVTTGGHPYPKGDRRPFLYRTHPKLLDLLTRLGVNVVTTANNHSIDFGREALLEQKRYLTQAGIASPGSGAHWKEAVQPAYIRLEDDTIVAFISFFSFWPIRRYAAADNLPGVFHEPDHAVLKKHLVPLLLEARRHAHLVVVSPHWTKNWTKTPGEENRALAHWLVEQGVDAVLGHSAHVLQGIEIHHGVPIVYDMGCMLVDRVGHGKQLQQGAAFRLHFNREGFHLLEIIPLHLRGGRTSRARWKDARFVLDEIGQLTREIDPLSTLVEQDEALYVGFVRKDLPPKPEASPPFSFAPARQRIRQSSDIPIVSTSLPQAMAERIARSPLAILEQNVVVQAVEVPQVFAVGTGFLLKIVFIAPGPLPRGRWEIHIVGQHTETGQQALWDAHCVAQGLCNPYLWKTGQHVLHQGVVRTPVQISPGNYHVRMGLYLLSQKHYRKGEEGAAPEKIHWVDIGTIEASADKSLPRVCSGLDWNGLYS